MSTTALVEKHVHYWQIDSQNHGICSICQTEQQFPWEATSDLPVIFQNPYKTTTDMIQRGRFTDEKLKELLDIGIEKFMQKYDYPRKSTSCINRAYEKATNKFTPKKPSETSKPPPDNPQLAEPLVFILRMTPPPGMPFPKKEEFKNAFCALIDLIYQN